MTHPILKVVQDKGCQSYLIGCRATGEALIVDPKLGRRKTILQLLRDMGLKGAAVLDTHTHADHLSESIPYVHEGLPLYMSRLTRCQRDLVRIGAGDEVRVGELSFRVVEVPGHTDDSIALIGHGLAIVGDTLLPGSLARSDFRGSDPARLFDAVGSELMTLPDQTVVLPGHSYRDILFTTIGVERRTNPALKHATGADYAAALGVREGGGNTPDVDRMLRLNVDANPQIPDEAPPVAASCDSGGGGGDAKRAREEAPPELAERRESILASGEWVDVREEYEFRAAHIPGTTNIPLAELGFHLDELRGKVPLVLSCLGGVRSMTAARTLRYLDVSADPISMSGGFREWKGAGLTTE